MKEDLNYWLETLQTFKNLRLIPAPEPREINWVGDASTSFGIGVLIGPRWCQYKLRPGWESSQRGKRGIAWLETVAIRLGIMMLIQLNWSKGQNLNVWTDNTTCEATLKKRKSRDQSVNEEWKLIQNLLITNQWDMNPLRVTSNDNTADELSRGISTDHREDQRVKFILPPDLEEALEITPVRSSQ